MYEIADDFYCYPNSTVLKNLADIRSAHGLETFETAMTAQRFDEPLPVGRFGLSHYLAVHHHIFQDVYDWAGKPRRIRVGKDGSWFCYPEHIRRELQALFRGLRQKRLLRGLKRDKFVAEAATFLASLNAIHAFRDGNGRTQLAFMAMLADRAGYPLRTDRLQPAEFLAAMIQSFEGVEAPLAAELDRMIG
jgi:cell filamentation protein